MSPLFNELLIPLILAMILAINMGGSGTAPAFSAAFGANLVRRDLIPGMFGIMVFLGSIIAGKAVATTMGKGILPADSMTLVLTSIILGAVSLSLLLANILGVPQSTSQATVMAITGPALYYNELNTRKLFLEIIPTWFILPIIAFVITYFLGKYIYTPMKKRSTFDFERIEQHAFLKFLVIISSLYVAFAIGANNVANASGPIATMVMNELNIAPDGKNFITIMILSTLIIAPNFGLGSSIFGHKVVESTGKEIVQLGPLSASVVSILTASLLLTASLSKGIPTSLVQLNTCSILALGVAKEGWKNIFGKSTVKRFWVVWIVAPLIAFLVSYLMTWIFDQAGLIG